MTARKQTAVQRFAGKVCLPTQDGCWQWLGGKSRGYGQFRMKGSVVGAHRHAYELFIGPIPAGLTLDHLCRNRACVNPAHLEPVTCRENVLRGVSIMARRARQAHCLRGHPLSGSNLHIEPKRHRRCRACHAATQRAWWTRQTQVAV